MNITAESADLAWSQTVRLLMGSSQVKSRNGSAYEEVGLQVTILDPTQNVVSNSVRNLSMNYAMGELAWYLSGSDRLAFIKRFAPSYDRFSDDGLKLHGAYGPRIARHLMSVIRKVTEPGDRRVVIPIFEPLDMHYSGKDCPCTLSLCCFLCCITTSGKIMEKF